MFRFSEEARKTFEAMPIPLAYYQMIDGNIRAILVSDGLCEMMGADRERLLKGLNNSLLAQVHPDDVGRLSRVIREFSEGLCGYDVIYRARYGSDNEYHYVHSIARMQQTPDGDELALFMYTDVSKSESESNLLLENYRLFEKDRFYNDPVTGLPNVNYLREFWTEMSERYFRDGRKPLLIYFDVINLSYYNAQYGYSHGDDLLRLVADVLKDLFPKAAVIRGAEDHFIVLSGQTEEKKLSEIIRSLNERVRTGAYGNISGVRAGICPLTEEMSLPDALDYARHALKQIGNDLNITYLYYTQDTDDSYWNQRYFLEAFDTALEQGWIKVYYQAIVRVRTGKIAAFEALSRWVDPQWGMILPTDFIPVLEKHHLLYKLDLYMVEQICREIPQRKELGLPILPVSVNFSAQDFDHLDVVEALNEIFERHQLSKNCIVIEITEQALAKATDEFRQQLENLRNNGYKLWIDDFGSGYSSLNIYSKYKVDLTKFDLDFMLHLNDNEGANRHIMKAMVEVTKALGHASLAEGVESEEQLEFLRSIGCDFAQGFYFYKPQSLGIIAFKLNKGQPYLPCETPEERRQYLMEYWANRLSEQH